ncbi:mCG144703, partial [Mus musculus]
SSVHLLCHRRAWLQEESDPGTSALAVKIVQGYLNEEGRYTLNGDRTVSWTGRKKKWEEIKQLHSRVLCSGSGCHVISCLMCLLLSLHNNGLCFSELSSKIYPSSAELLFS